MVLIDVFLWATPRRWGTAWRARARFAEADGIGPVRSWGEERMGRPGVRPDRSASAVV